MLIGKLVLSGLLLAAAGTDIAWRKIPNSLIAAGLAAFLIIAGRLYIRGETAVLAGCLGAGAAAFCIHLIPYLLRSMGAGDVKLALVMGLLMGWRDWTGFLGIYGIVMLVASGLLLIMGKRKPKTVPLAPFMTAAYFLYNLFVVYSPLG